MAMRIFTLALLFVCACTKHNPNVCCNDEADCNANGIPVGIFADPKVVDFRNDDFHLTATSPALNTADPAAVDTHDFDGVARPQGAGPDLGAFEFH
jgi:hypothetical protein